jgi:prevent-host-death family protein
LSLVSYRRRCGENLAGRANLAAVGAQKPAALQFSLTRDPGNHSMLQFSIADLLRGIKAVTMAADSQPVIITQRHQPRFVLMTYDEYQTMTKTRANPRRVFGPGETPAELAKMILPELDRLIEEGA